MRSSDGGRAIGEKGLSPSDPLHRVTRPDHNASGQESASSGNQDNPRRRRFVPPVEDHVELSEEALREARASQLRLSPTSSPDKEDRTASLPVPAISFRAQV
jgi:hypothetical protein